MKQYLTILFIVITMNGMAQSNFQSYFKDGLYQFDNTIKIQKSQIFTTYASNFGFTPDNLMALQVEGPMDENGGVSSRYAQYYNGYPVENTSMNVISKYGIVLYVNGFSLPNLSANVTDPITEAIALDNALKEVGAAKYAWEDAELEQNLKTGADLVTADSIYDSTQTYYPKGELVIACPWGDSNYNDTSKYALCWKFMITPMHWSESVVIDTNTVDTIPHYDTVAKYIRSSNIIIYINAITGDLFKIDSNNRNWSYVSCTVSPTYYDGDGRTVEAWKKDLGLTRYARDGKNIDVEDLFNPGGIWGINSSTWGKSTEASAFWCFEKAHEYFSVRHGFTQGPNSYSTDPVARPHNNEQKIYTNFEPLSTEPYVRLKYQKGIGTRDTYYIGKNRDYDPEAWKSAAQLDMIAHEYTHGMIHGGPDFIDDPYSDAAAIAEGFCDYFGVYAATWFNPSRYLSDWTDGIGHQFFGGIDHHFNDPTLDHFPSLDNYGGPGFSTVGPESRSGILRKVLGLSEWGGTHNGISVNAIPDPLTDVFVTMYWWSWSNMNYTNMRDQFLAEYKSYYGICSPKYNSMSRAWAAVGLGPVATCAKTYLDNQTNVVVVTPTGGDNNTYGPIAGWGNPNVHPRPIINVNYTSEEETLKTVSYDWQIPQAWYTTFPGGDQSNIEIDSVTSLESDSLVCIVTFQDASTDRLVRYVHFVVDGEYETANTVGRHAAQPVSAAAATAADVQLYPNPAHSQLSITLPAEPAKGMALHITDITGRDVLQKELHHQQSTIALPGLPAGLYIVRIKGEGNDYVKRLEIQ